jgi:hypothetical protein
MSLRRRKAEGRKEALDVFGVETRERVQVLCIVARPHDGEVVFCPLHLVEVVEVDRHDEAVQESDRVGSDEEPLDGKAGGTDEVDHAQLEDQAHRERDGYENGGEVSDQLVQEMTFHRTRSSCRPAACYRSGTNDLK